MNQILEWLLIAILIPIAIVCIWTVVILFSSSVLLLITIIRKLLFKPKIPRTPIGSRTSETVGLRRKI